jgi:hypothetical protein
VDFCEECSFKADGFNLSYDACSASGFLGGCQVNGEPTFRSKAVLNEIFLNCFYDYYFAELYRILVRII